MNTNIPYDELSRIVANRSICNVRVGAVIYDGFGIFAWGWNHAGNGFGQHAEHHAISRSNPRRLVNSTIVVTAFRRKKQITSVPCPDCYNRILAARIGYIVCALPDGEWVTLKVSRDAEIWSPITQRYFIRETESQR